MTPITKLDMPPIIVSTVINVALIFISKAYPILTISYIDIHINDINISDIKRKVIIVFVNA